MDLSNISRTVVFAIIAGIVSALRVRYPNFTFPGEEFLGQLADYVGALIVPVAMILFRKITKTPMTGLVTKVPE